MLEPAETETVAVAPLFVLQTAHVLSDVFESEMLGARTVVGRSSGRHWAVVHRLADSSGRGLAPSDESRPDVVGRDGLREGSEGDESGEFHGSGETRGLNL
jgi:hypothetical protein